MEKFGKAGGEGKNLTSNQIKCIAIIAMTIDHFLWLLYPGCQRIPWVMGLHMIGRITAPIMWFFMAEGFYYTRSRKKYGQRLFFFAILSHFAYNFAGGIPFIPQSIFNATSVMWPLAWSVVLMSVFENPRYPQWAKVVFSFFVCAVTFPADWSCIAAMCPAFLYAHRGDFKKQCLDILIWTGLYALVYFFAVDPVYAILQFATLLSLPILYFYGGSRGRCGKMKWLFYIYYPAHLFFIGLIRILLEIESIFPG